MGATRSGSRPAAAITSRASSYQDASPWLVTWYSPGRRSTHSRSITAATSGVNDGEPRWSVTNLMGASSAASRNTVPTMLAPWRPHSHEVRTTVAASPASCSPASLLAPYTDRGSGRSHS